jgi:hypothetical protein
MKKCNNLGKTFDIRTALLPTFVVPFEHKNTLSGCRAVRRIFSPGGSKAYIPKKSQISKDTALSGCESNRSFPLPMQHIQWVKKRQTFITDIGMMFLFN